MGSSKTSLNELTFDFSKELTDAPVLEFPLFMQPEVLPHEPPTNWRMKANGWPQLQWTDPIIPPSLQGLEAIHFTPFDLEGFSDTMTRLSTTGLTSPTFKLMVEGRAQFVLEDYCHIPKEKGYLCMIGEEGMMAHEYIVSETNKEDIFIPACIFPLHLFSLKFNVISIFPSTNFFIKLLGRLCPLSGLVNT